MKLWLDAQLSPEIAVWITTNFGIDAVAVRDIGLRDASDLEIFTANERLRQIFEKTLREALALLEAGEDLVEIAG